MSENWATEGEVWTVSGLLEGWPFEHRFTSWDTHDPERSARIFYDGQTFLRNATLLRQVEARTESLPVESKNSYADDSAGSAYDAKAHEGRYP